MTKSFTVPGIIAAQSDDIKQEIARLAETQHYDVIVKWLDSIGVHVTWSQVRYYLQTRSIDTRFMVIPPVTSHEERVRIYIAALMKYTSSTFKIANLRLNGSTWSVVTARLHKAGLIEPINCTSPIRWQIIGTKEQFKEWGRAELNGDHDYGTI